MHLQSLLQCCSLCLVLTEAAKCPVYTDYSEKKHAPYSSGKYKLSSQRPTPACRTFNDSGVDRTISRLKNVVKDPDLYRLFENSFPNTLDTTIAWKGHAANNAKEELTFVITGDINVSRASHLRRARLA